MKECNKNAIEDLKEIAIQRLKKINNATNDATKWQYEEQKHATNKKENEDQKLIDWFFENYEKLPKGELNISETKSGRETWHEPQKIYDFIIKNSKENINNSNYLEVLVYIKKLKEKFNDTKG